MITCLFIFPFLLFWIASSFLLAMTAVVVCLLHALLSLRGTKQSRISSIELPLYTIVCWLVLLLSIIVVYLFVILMYCCHVELVALTRHVELVETSPAFPCRVMSSLSRHLLLKSWGCLHSAIAPVDMTVIRWGLSRRSARPSQPSSQ